MDFRTFMERVSDDRDAFEKFCDYALRNWVLTGEAKDNFVSRSRDWPFDAETSGSFQGCEGVILFEYKRGKSLGKIKSDLLEKKLIRADQLKPGAAAYVLIMGNEWPSTKFQSDINEHISTHNLPFKFLCLPPDVVEQWTLDHPSLLDIVFPSDRTPTIEEFIEDLAKQGAPVSFKNYRNLDNLYVPPREYDHIVQVLRDKRIVFIIGEPHVGKTFTATRIMRHFNICFGKKAHWLLPKEPGREPGPERFGDRLSSKPNSILDLLEGKVGDNKITYIEDIFGRTSDEEVRWDRPRPQDVLYELINYMNGKGRDGLVLVTSREKLFDKALEADPQLNDFIVRLGPESRVCLELDSYSAADKIQLLINYARLHECVWFTGDPDTLPPDVLHAASELQTPHAIFYFCESSRNARTPEDREPHFKTSKQELVKAFMNEIAGLDDTTLAILLTAAFAKPQPEIFAQAFPELAGQDALSAWMVSLRKLSGRINGSYYFYIEYSHPSYKEALFGSMATIERVRKIFSKMSGALARDSETKMRINSALALTRNFEHLDPEGKELLQKLAKDKETDVRMNAAIELAWNFEHLDPEGKELLQKLAKDKETDVRGGAAGALAENFKHLDSEGKELLQKLAKDKETDVRMNAAVELAWKFENLDSEGKELLRKLAEDQETEVRKSAAKVLTTIFANLDSEGKELLRKLTFDEAKEVRRVVAESLMFNFWHVDPELKGLLRKLAEDKEKEVRTAAAQRLALHYWLLGIEGKKLLRKLGKDEETEVRRIVAKTLTFIFWKLDPDEIELLDLLASDADPEVREAATKRKG